MRMHKSFYIISIPLILLAITLKQGSHNADKKKVTIAVIAPMQHAAMDAIVEGVLEVLDNNQEENITVKYFNAGGDFNLQQAMIQQMEGNDIDLIMPIGTSAMQMAINFIKSKPIVGLAANLSATDQMNLPAQNATCVLDELPSLAHLQLMKRIIDDLKKITVIYSASEKIAPEIEQLKELTEREGLEAQFLLVQQMTDIFSIAAHISKNSQALFILKDHMVVSAVATLIDAAKKLKIPLITTDEGSVIEGASFALGVTEADIGKTGALMAIEIIKGKSPGDISVVTVDQLRLFVNRSACEMIGIDLKHLEKAGDDISVLLELKDEVVQ